MEIDTDDIEIDEHTEIEREGEMGEQQLNDSE